MENITNNIRTWVGSGLFAAAALTLWSACSDDDEAVKLQLSAPVVSVDSITYNGLGFSWSPVAGAYQYQYELREDNGVLAEGNITTDTQVYISGLDAETTYTLSVVAYAQDVMNSIGSEPGTATATTTSTTGEQKLWSVNGIYKSGELGQSWTSTLVAYTTHYELLSWCGVEGYDLKFTLNADSSLNVADYYEVDEYGYYVVPTGLSTYSVAYIYLDNECSSFTGTAQQGELKLYSYFVSGGYDSFTWGEDADDEENNAPAVLWSTDGTYQSAELGESWTSTLVAYDDNHYEIQSWYGVEGYNLKFTLNADSSLNVADYYEVYGGYYYVQTGLADNPGAYIYVDAGCSAFSGDAEEGQIYVYSYFSQGGYDYFTWSNKPASELVDADGVTWELMAPSVTVYEYYDALPQFTCSLYQSADGEKYMFKDFTKDYDLKFTKGDEVSELGNYIIPEGGSWYNTSYWYFGANLWNDSYPLYWKTLTDGQYLDYVALYAHSTYSTVNFDDKYGWICLYYNVYSSDGSAVTTDKWAYLQFYWN